MNNKYKLSSGHSGTTNGTKKDLKESLKEGIEIVEFKCSECSREVDSE